MTVHTLATRLNQKVVYTSSYGVVTEHTSAVKHLHVVDNKLFGTALVFTIPCQVVHITGNKWRIC